MKDKKPRKAIVNIAVRSGDTALHQWDEAQKSLNIAIKRDGKSVSAEFIDMINYYERPVKPKFISTFHTHRSRDFSVSQSDIIQNYAHVWAIDNSSKKAFGVTFNVAALCALDPTGSGGVERIGGVLFGQTAGNPERYGWRRWIEFLLLSTKAERRYAIIVDSDFGHIPAMNTRKIAIHGDFTLPDNFDLIYATADTGKDQVFNKAIAMSDALSKAMRLSVESEGNAKHFSDLIDEDTHMPIFLFCSTDARSGTPGQHTSPHS